MIKVNKYITEVAELIYILVMFYNMYMVMFRYSRDSCEIGLHLLLWATSHVRNAVCAFLDERSHRLTVRTPGFHPGNPGSIPGEITKNSYLKYSTNSSSIFV